MSILKYEPRTSRSLEDMYNYLTVPNKTSIEGIFAIGCNPQNVVDEMLFVQRIYFKERLLHPYLQVIFAFDRQISLPFVVLKDVCERIGSVLILDRRQLFGAIHYLGKDAEKIHCHYLINIVSIDGQLYRQLHSLHFYKRRVNDIIAPYGLTPIVMYSM